jgi:hypothetical protein
MTNVAIQYQNIVPQKMPALSSKKSTTPPAAQKQKRLLKIQNPEIANLSKIQKSGGEAHLKKPSERPRTKNCPEAIA